MKLLSKVRKIKREKGLSSFQTVIDSKFGLGKVECLLNINWFNPFLTIWLNFRSLPLKKLFSFRYGFMDDLVFIL